MIKALFAKKPKPGRYDFDPQSDSKVPQINNSTVIASSNFLDWSINGLKAAGVSVNEHTAMQVSAVYACVALIGGAIASLPLPVYKRTPDGREKTNHDVWWLLNEQPNTDYPAATFWESMLSSLLLHGDAFARIIRPSMVSQNITGFEWIHPHRVTVTKDKGLMVYTVRNWYPWQTGKDISYLASDIIHVAGPGFNGLRGMSQISFVLRTAAGIAIAADQYSAEFFENGARPDFAIELPNTPTKEQQDMMRDSWNDRYSGTGKRHKPALMAGGAKVHELTMNAEDSQLLSTRQFQVEDIARIFGVPPHMIGHTQNTTSWGSGVEQMSIGFIRYTLTRHLTKIEQELNRKIWPTGEKYFVEFNTAGLERGDIKTRTESYRISLGRAGENAWATINEVRRLENLPPIEGGDILSKASDTASSGANIGSNNAQ